MKPNKKNRKTPITPIIDEARELSHDEGYSAFMEGLARRARAYRGNLITGKSTLDPTFEAKFANSSNLSADFLPNPSSAQSPQDQLNQFANQSQDDN